MEISRSHERALNHPLPLAATAFQVFISTTNPLPPLQVFQGTQPLQQSNTEWVDDIEKLDSSFKMGPEHNNAMSFQIPGDFQRRKKNNELTFQLTVCDHDWGTGW